MPRKILHLLGQLEIGGLERAALRLASRGRALGGDHSLLLFDKPFRSNELDFAPGEVPTHFIPRGRGVDWRFTAKLARFLSESGVEIVHAHNDAAIFYGAAATLIARTPVSLIGTFGTRPSHTTLGARLLTRWATGRAAYVAAVSQELNDWLITAKWSRKCMTILGGVELVLFTPLGPAGGWRQKLRIPADALLVGHIGRFAPIKRHEDMFRAARLLEHAKPPIFFVFAGDGPLFQEFSERAADMPNVRVLPSVQDVPALLRNLDIFVLYSAHEGCPQALLEAMACGRAIIASHVGGVPEVLETGSGSPVGITLPPFRPDRLAEHIRRLAADKDLRTRLGERAQIRAEAFSFDEEWDRYAALYDSAG
ncbi:MAG: glycosyltransferase family 4 protein [Alphaproteobacteria bacterium]